MAARKNIYIILGTLLILLPATAFAQANFSFPVSELGECQNKSECKVYCDMPANMSACTQFAVRHGLVGSEKEETAALFSKALLSGAAPGNCQTISQCRAYCDVAMHLDECIRFTEKLNVNAPMLDYAKKVLRYLKSGGELPGGCDSQQSCLDYCLDTTHISECVSFGMNARIIPGGNDEDTEKEIVDNKDIVATTTDKLQKKLDQQEVVLGKHSFAGGVLDDIPENIDVAPEVFRFTSFPDTTAQCLKDRLGDNAEDGIINETISKEELRTAVESCILETLSADGSIPMNDLLEEISPRETSFRAITTQMLATPFRVATYVLHLLHLDR